MERRDRRRARCRSTIDGHGRPSRWPAPAPDADHRQLGINVTLTPAVRLPHLGHQGRARGRRAPGCCPDVTGRPDHLRRARAPAAATPHVRPRARRHRRRRRRAVHQRGRPAARARRRSLDGIARAPLRRGVAGRRRRRRPARARRASRSPRRRRRRQRRREQHHERRRAGRPDQPPSFTPGPAGPAAPRPTTASRSACAPASRPGRGGWSSSASSARSTSSGSGSAASSPAARVTRISLLFYGRVAIFGLTAAVDQLSITWHGGDVLAVASWSVDLMGLAVSADLAGPGRSPVACSRPSSGPTSPAYVGMLLGRFAIYGLSVFGGYTGADGDPSFFVFGARQRADRRSAGLLRHRHRRRPGHQPRAGHPGRPAASASSRSSRRSTRPPTPATRWTELPRAQRLLPAPARQLLVRRPASASPASPSSTASRSSPCPSADGLEIDLLGLARMALPRPQAALVSIELGLLARFSTSEGVFMIKAAAHRQLVAALPGRPAHRRLRVRPVVEGAAGRAVRADAWAATTPTSTATATRTCRGSGSSGRSATPSCIKGESLLRAHLRGADGRRRASIVVADFGWVWARVEFGADGIVYFDPFWFEVEAYARISAGIDIDLGWFGDDQLQHHPRGADQGRGARSSPARPSSRSGRARSPIEFGSAARQPPPDARLADVRREVPRGRRQRPARALSAITGKGTLPTATGGEQCAPTSDGTPARRSGCSPSSSSPSPRRCRRRGFAFGAAGAASRCRSLVRRRGRPPLGLSPMRPAT